MGFDYGEKLSPQIAEALVGDRFDPNMNYYMYSALHECSVYAVNPVTGEECWHEGMRLDDSSDDTSVGMHSGAAYYGHWFVDRKKVYVPIVPVLIVVLFVVSMCLMLYIDVGGF